MDGSTLEVQYGYLGDEGSNFSRIGSITYPNGEVVVYSHDAIGRVTGAQSESYGGGPIETLSYLGLSTTIGRTVGDDVASMAIALDNMGRVGTLNWTGNSDVIEGFAWTYDRNGNPLSRVRNSDTRGNNDFDELYHESGHAANAYTNLDQIQYWLRGEIADNEITSPLESRTESYDGIGNATGGTDTRIFDNQNRPTEMNSSPVTRDALGNITEDHLGNEFGYDAWNRLTTHDATDRYGYDALNRRNRFATRDLHYDADGNIIEEREDGIVTLQHHYSKSGHGIVARRNFASGSYSSTYYAMTLTDGSVMTIISGTGLQLEHYVYNPNGLVEMYAEGEFGDWTHDPEMPDREGAYGWTVGWQGGWWDGAALQWHNDLHSVSPFLTVTLAPRDSVKFPLVGASTTPTHSLYRVGMHVGHGTNADFDPCQYIADEIKWNEVELRVALKAVEQARDNAKKATSDPERKLWMDVERGATLWAQKLLVRLHDLKTQYKKCLLDPGTDPNQLPLRPRRS